MAVALGWLRLGLYSLEDERETEETRFHQWVHSKHIVSGCQDNTTLAICHVAMPWLSCFVSFLQPKERVSRAGIHVCNMGVINAAVPQSQQRARREG